MAGTRPVKGLSRHILAALRYSTDPWTVCSKTGPRDGANALNRRLPMKPTHNVYVPYTFEKGGEEVKKHTLVGSAWVKDTAKGQVVSINLRPGISVSGELVLFEANEDN